MKRFFVFLLVLLCIAIAMVITCPEKEVHEEKVSEKISAIFTNEVKSRATTDDDMITAVFGSAIASKLIDVVIEQNLEVDNYYVLSIGKLTFNGETNPVSLGVFNHVFLMGNFDELKESLKEIE